MCNMDIEECLVCFDETHQFQVFLCGHKVCMNCYPRLRSTKCPVCNQTIEIVTEDHVMSKRGCCLILSVVIGIVVYSFYY